MNLTNFKWDKDSDGIVTLTWDVPGKPVNLLSMAAIAELGQVAEAIGTDASVKGLVLASAKEGNFCAGADLDEMSAFARSSGPDAATRAFAAMMNLHKRSEEQTSELQSPGLI